MIPRRVALAAAVGGVALAGAGIALAGAGGGWLLAVAGGGLAALLAGLYGPWQGTREWFAIQYEASTVKLPALGTVLTNVAAVTGQGVTWCWRWEAGQLSAFLALPAGSREACERALAQLIPGLLCVPVAPPPWPAGVVYRATGSAQHNLLNGNTLLDGEVFTDDGQVRIQITPTGGAILLAGEPNTAARAWVRPLWRPWLRLRAAGVQRLDRALLTRYALLTPWPPAGVQLGLPVLGAPATAPLNRGTTQHQALPPTYIPPRGPAVPLGWSTVDGRPLALPLTATGNHSPLLIVGHDPATRLNLLARLSRDVVSAGGTVMQIDPLGNLSPRLAGLVPEVPTTWIDLGNPGSSARLNLLAPGTASAEIANVEAMQERVLRLLEQYLGGRGALPIGNIDYETRLADEVRYQWAGYYRARWGGQPAAPPTLWSVYQALAGAATPPAALRAELAAWTTPPPALAALLAAAGNNGTGLQHGICATIADMIARLEGETPAERRFTATAISNRMRPLMEHPGLIHFWRDANYPPVDLAAQPGLWLCRVPCVGGTESDSRAAWRYAAYVLTCLRSLTATPPARPLWVIVEEAPTWTSEGHIDVRSDLTELTNAGIGVVLTARSVPATYWADWPTQCYLDLNLEDKQRLQRDGRSALAGLALQPGMAFVQLPGGGATIIYQRTGEAL